ncbi:MAG: nitrate- and nitrite sensing domain-containing protein, partial [Actinomycetota bacterium]|nr:nitrate- and nitrite sensing domain-containing protein [Actinomycetota bacterium]
MSDQSGRGRSPSEVPLPNGTSSSRLRAKLTVIVLVPLLLAGVFGALRVETAVQQADSLDAADRDLDFAQRVAAVVHELQRERELMAGLVASDGPSGRAEVDAQIPRVDEKIRFLETATSDLRPGAAPSHALPRTQWDGLVELRDTALASADPAADAIVAGYTELITAALDLERRTLLGIDARLVRMAASVSALIEAKESVALQHANLLIAIEAGNVTPVRAATLRNVDAGFDAEIAQFTALSSEQQVALYKNTVTGAAVADREQLEESALASAATDAELDIDPQQWSTASRITTDLIRQVEVALLDQLRAAGDTLAARGWHAAMRDLAILGAALALALAVMVILSRSLLRPLRVPQTNMFGIEERPAPDEGPVEEYPAPGEGPVEERPAVSQEQTATAGAGLPVRAAPVVKLPVKVVVVDAPGGKAKAAGPSDPSTSYVNRSSTSQVNRQAKQRTIEDEWVELVGGPDHLGPEWRAVSSGRTNIQPGREQLDETGGPSNPVPPGEGVMDIRAGASAAEDEPIFEELASAWFQERRSVPSTSGTVPVSAPDDTATPPDGIPAGGGTTVGASSRRPDAAEVATGSSWAPPLAAQQWESAADEGWQAAQNLHNPRTSGFTPAGLPKRQPRAQLVPGAPGVSRHAP